MKKLIVILIAFLLVVFLIVQWLGRGGLGSHWGAGTPTAVALSASDECMSETEQRAWSSPITVGWTQSRRTSLFLVEGAHNGFGSTLNSFGICAG